MALSNGNLTLTWTTGSPQPQTRASVAQTPSASASYYWEATPHAEQEGIGLCNNLHDFGIGPGYDATSFVWWWDGSVRFNGVLTPYPSAAFVAGDVLGIELLAGSVKLYRNGTLVNTLTSYPGNALFPIVTFWIPGQSLTGNFGPSFAHRPAGATDWRGAYPPRGYVRSADRRTLSGSTDSTNGGYWVYKNQTGRIHVAWFGGKNDYFVTDQATGLATVNPSPTNNHDAIINASRFLFGAPPGYLSTGPTVEFSIGGYYIGSTINTGDIGRAVKLVGNGFSILTGSTRFIFPAGTKGFYCPLSRPIHLESLDIVSLGWGGHTDMDGIHAESPVILHYTTVSGFGGHGCNIAADVYASPSSNANLWKVIDCVFKENAGSGLKTLGGDANAGTARACNFMNNARYGRECVAFLGNGDSDHHTQGNTLGAYYINNANTMAALINCYSESDQPPSLVQGHVSVLGGLHAAGVAVTQGCTAQFGSRVIGGLWVTPPSGQDAGDVVTAGFRAYANSLLTFSKTATAVYDWKYIPNIGWMIQYANLAGRFSFGITPQEGCTLRNPAIPENRMLCASPLYVGNDYSKLRGKFTTTGTPSITDHQVLIGDDAVEMGTGTFRGWMPINSDASGATGTAVWCKYGNVGDTIYVTLDPPSLAAGATSTEVTQTGITGAKVGDIVRVTMFGGDSQGIVADGARISTDGTAKWFWRNPTAGTIDLASATWGITWQRPF